MLLEWAALLCGGGVLAVALWLASKNGSKSARLEALQAELKKQAEEQARAQRIMDKVSYLSGDDARRRLHDVANRGR